MRAVRGYNVGALRKWALAIAIAVVFNLFVNYGISTFYPAPDYNDFCNASSYGAYPARPFREPAYSGCHEVFPSDELSAGCMRDKGHVAYNYNASNCPVSAYCEFCERDFRAAGDHYENNVFFILVPLGVAAVIAGVLIGVESVGVGFLLGGLISIFIGTVRNWGNLGELHKFLLLGVILAILVFVGYRKVRD